MRVGYLSGPVDASEVVSRWLEKGKLDYFGTSYLTELLNVTERPVIVTYTAGDDTYRCIEGIRIYNLGAKPAGGIRFHLLGMWTMLKSINILIKTKVDVAVVTALADYFFLLPILRLAGIKIVPALHCQLFNPFVARRGHQRVLDSLNRTLFWQFQKTPTLIASDAIGRQVRGETRLFLPTYPPELFRGNSEPGRTAPFVILSAGRIEENKGVFDMVEVADILVRRGFDIELHFCGEGTQLAELRDRATGKPIVVHGMCGREKLLDLFAKAHVVVVPTRTDFEEGFAMICAEGVMAGRVVVTSRVCPALEYIHDAAIEVEPNDVQGYADAITKLITDRDFYDRKVAMTSSVARQFFDQENSYGTALAQVLKELGGASIAKSHRSRIEVPKR